MDNVNIDEFLPLVKPSELKKNLKISDEIKNNICKWRNDISNIITGKSKRKLFIVGPCSIHNTEEALEYAKKLKIIADKVTSTIMIVMRVYFEKPRTTVGWKGLINDPYLNNTYKVNDGLGMARELLININKLGLPCGYEVLDTITPQYICDLISWGAIGARTVESQVHRQMVSGLSMPVGFKNGTSGDKKVARDAILSAKYPHCFMGITDNGEPAICKTKGNSLCHIILRGGKNGGNYSKEDINEMCELLKEKNLLQMIMIDCSHDNSGKDYTKQKLVLDAILNNKDCLDNICGIMIESNLEQGKQNINVGGKDLKKGVSITDGCVGIIETERILLNANNRLNNRLNNC
jgi:3-deoxy-7-phosphoheptulonate synthase